MNIFTMETWFTIQLGVISIFGLLGVLTLVLSNRAYKHRHEEKRQYDDSPAWVLWLVATFFCALISGGVAHNAFSAISLVNKSCELHSTRRHLIDGPCFNEKALGCSLRWTQYRADSVWLETRLSKFNQ